MKDTITVIIIIIIIIIIITSISISISIIIIIILILYIKNESLDKLKISKDTQREKVPSNKIPALSKIMNMVIWVIGT